MYWNQDISSIFGLPKEKRAAGHFTLILKNLTFLVCGTADWVVFEAREIS